MTNEFIQQNFVTPEIAKALKELGFNEPCLGFFSAYKPDDNKFMICAHENYTKPAFIQNDYGGNTLAAPLWQQACVFLNRISKHDQIEPVFENMPDLESQMKIMIEDLKSQQSTH